ncbi:hypothetical protein SSX86_002130 [Deinandra increscens subsp. villosa]|uniref:Mitotic checkpoint serine/threonine-protein kinase BUB1 n=1 Tax=Deinandra increscens subsp. villosa TaxID=3103831 RepID=A0AAP0H7Q9_9ASTR
MGLVSFFGSTVGLMAVPYACGFPDLLPLIVTNPVFCGLQVYRDRWRWNLDVGFDITLVGSNIIFPAPIPMTLAPGEDPLLPHLRSIEAALDKFESSKNNGEDVYEELVYDCIQTFKHQSDYRNDIRFLKIWLIYLDFCPDHKAVFEEIERLKICLDKSLLYESYALLLEAMGMMGEAHFVYQSGISRNAEPIGRLKKAHEYFLERMHAVVDTCSSTKVSLIDEENGYVNPWSISIIKNQLQKMNAQISKYQGYHASSKCYSGKVALSTLHKSVRNKMIEIGGKKYQIKGCAGKGGFAQVYKACANGNADEVVALKIQKPPFPWEFYMYRQVDKRIQKNERMCFGYAHRLHLYSDYSILVSDFLAHGTLLDAINTNVCTGVSMDEVLCIHYTIEMLSMLENLHGNGIIHGDFKPDNLLMRYASADNLTEDGFGTRSGPWHEQGLCLVDWGRGIDLQLFPNNVKFNGDCRTSGFRCVQMQENKPWTYQVDTYGLCVIVHLMLHNTYLEIDKKPSPDGYSYQPKSPFKRYQQVDLWKKLFMDLLNNDDDDEHLTILGSLRKSFQDYMCSNPHLIKQLKQSLTKQRISMCSS